MKYQFSRVKNSQLQKAFLLLVLLFAFAHSSKVQAVAQGSFKNLRIFCPGESRSKEIYKDGSLTNSWIAPPQNSQTCRPNPIVQEKSDTRYRNIQLNNTNPNPKDNSIHITQVSVTTNDTTMIDVSCSHNSIILDKPSDYLFTIITKCKQSNPPPGADWGVVNVTLYSNETNESISFFYQKLCGEDYDIRLDWGYAILLIISIALVGIGSRSMTTIIKNEELKVVHVFIFVAVLTGCYILLFYFVLSLDAYTTIFLSFASFLAAVFVINNVFQHFFSQGDCLMCKLRVPGLGKVTFTTILCVLISIGLVAAWHWRKNWILGNLLAICMLFALIKFAKVTSMKVGAVLLISVIAAHLIWSSIAALLSNPVHGNLNSSINLPMSLTFPHLGPFPTKGTCFSVNIIECVFPGLFIAFCYRYDKAKGLKLFYVAGMFGFIIGLVIHTTLYYTEVIKLRPIIYVGLCTLVCVFVVAFRRNEHKDLWDGLHSEREFAAHLLRNIDLDDKKNPKIPDFDSHIFDSIDLKKQTETMSISSVAPTGISPSSLREIRLNTQGDNN